MKRTQHHHHSLRPFARRLRRASAEVPGYSNPAIEAYLRAGYAASAGAHTLR